MSLDIPYVKKLHLAQPNHSFLGIQPMYKQLVRHSVYRHLLDQFQVGEAVFFR